MAVFGDLRAANLARQAEWDTKSQTDLSYAGNELSGEAGELIEAATDILSGSNNYEALNEEVGDVVICCDLIAMRYDLILNTSVNLFYEEESEVKDILLDMAIQVGMVSNTIKKIERERFGMVGARGSVDDMRRNLDEVVYHVHRLARAMGVNVSLSVANKFNLTSFKYGLETGMAI